MKEKREKRTKKKAMVVATVVAVAAVADEEVCPCCPLGHRHIDDVSRLRLFPVCCFPLQRKRLGRMQRITLHTQELCSGARAGVPRTPHGILSCMTSSS
jgi:hypothetical protein